LWSPTSIGPLLYKRNVVTIHDISYLDNPEWFSSTYVALYSNLQPLVIHKSVHIVAVSEYTKQRIIELCKVSEDKISVIYEGCDDIFKPQDPVSVKSVLEDIGIRGRYILALGAVSPRKNFSRQLAAWKSIADRYKDVELVIVGKNGLQFSGENELGVLPNRTRHLTTVDDNFLVKLMAGATALLYASLYEGFGLPIIEAMNTGTPVMTGNITSMPEIAGNAALLVDPYNIDEIANGICRLLDDDGLRCQLRDKGFERVKMFTWDNAAQRTWDLLKTLA
jgi:glycosyltransferase involved in cell wall biosynthesis